MSLLLTPSSRAGLATVHDLTVLVVANVSRFLLIWCLTMAAFISYAFLQPLQYRYSTVIKLPEISVKGQPRALVSGPDLIEYLTNVTVPNLQVNKKQKALLKKIKFTSSPGSNLLIVSADTKESDIVSPLMNTLAKGALEYCRSAEILAKDEVAKTLTSRDPVSLSLSQIIAPALHGQNSLNLGEGVIVALGFIFATVFGILSVIFSAFSEKVREDVQRLKTENASAGG